MEFSVLTARARRGFAARAGLVRRGHASHPGGFGAANLKRSTIIKNLIILKDNIAFREFKISSTVLTFPGDGFDDAGLRPIDDPPTRPDIPEADVITGFTGLARDG